MNTAVHFLSVAREKGKMRWRQTTNTSRRWREELFLCNLCFILKPSVQKAPRFICFQQLNLIILNLFKAQIRHLAFTATLRLRKYPELTQGNKKEQSKKHNFIQETIKAFQ